MCVTLGKTIGVSLFDNGILAHNPQDVTRQVATWDCRSGDDAPLPRPVLEEEMWSLWMRSGLGGRRGWALPLAHRGCVQTRQLHHLRPRAVSYDEVGAEDDEYYSFAMRQAGFERGGGK